MDKREKVARAIFDASTFYGEWDRQPKANQEVCYSMADAAIAALEPVTVQEARPISDVPPDGTWAVLHPGHYGAFTACALHGKWSMCDDADLRFATHWVPCPFTALAEKAGE